MAFEITVSFLGGVGCTILGMLLLAQYGIRNASQKEIDEGMQNFVDKMKQ